MSARKRAFETKADVLARAERSARGMLCVSWREALERYYRGDLRGTLAEAEIKSLLLLLDSAAP